MVMVCESIRILFPDVGETVAEVTSPATNQCNCVVWAAGENHRWWWPVRNHFSAYWPSGVERSETRVALVQVSTTLGLVECISGTLELGVEKMALFGNGPVGGETPTHALRMSRSRCG